MRTYVSEQVCKASKLPIREARRALSLPDRLVGSPANILANAWHPVRATDNGKPKLPGCGHTCAMTSPAPINFRGSIGSSLAYSSRSRVCAIPGSVFLTVRWMLGQKSLDAHATATPSAGAPEWWIERFRKRHQVADHRPASRPAGCRPTSGNA